MSLVRETGYLNSMLEARHTDVPSERTGYSNSMLEARHTDVPSERDWIFKWIPEYFYPSVLRTIPGCPQA